jgi:hypothetical protein
VDLGRTPITSSPGLFMVLATASHALGARGLRWSSMAETVYHHSLQNAKQGPYE